MQYLRQRYVAVLVLAVFGFAGFYGIRRVQSSCADRVDYPDPPKVARTEPALFLREAASLYDQQHYNLVQNAPLAKPLKARVSGRVAALWVSRPVYEGDFQYAQLWQQGLSPLS